MIDLNHSVSPWIMMKAMFRPFPRGRHKRCPEVRVSVGRHLHRGGWLGTGATRRHRWRDEGRGDMGPIELNQTGGLTEDLKSLVNLTLW